MDLAQLLHVVVNQVYLDLLGQKPKDRLFKVLFSCPLESWVSL